MDNQILGRGAQQALRQYALQWMEQARVRFRRYSGAEEVADEFVRRMCEELRRESDREMDRLLYGDPAAPIPVGPFEGPK